MRGREQVGTGRSVRRVTRELRRLEALAARRRLRVRLLRGLRGTLGTGATLVALVKFKLAASLGLKVALAVLVGIGLAWPFLVLAVLTLIGLVLALVSVFEGGHAGSLDCPDGSGCERREKRDERLKHLIATRREWLDAQAVPPTPP